MTRVVSLVPAGTEIVAALGAGRALVGISHQCDWPPSVQHLPRVTATPLDPSLPSAEMDAAVRRLRESGRPVIAVDGETLRRLRPTLLLTQDLCAVCAVTGGGVAELAQVLAPPPDVLPLRARTLAGIMDDIGTVARALDAADEAAELVAGLRYRLGRLRARAPARAPRVACLEWLDPLFLAGHWVPELIEAAGGEDVGARPGDHSRTTTLDSVRALAPDVVLVAPCGFGLERGRQEYATFEAGLRAAGTEPPSVWARVRFVDGNAYTSRPGPRVADGAERIAEAIGA